ncbi:MAG: FtsX-like permease family protein [Planctomycetaceae bacterium]|nr:FtsX-like permease family protein [Planctomycetaceae bacterium]
MFKLLLTWRYLKTRFIALASIISVTLGVATLIVVNSVMSGFSNEMTSKLHGILSDVELVASGMGEIDRVDEKVEQIKSLLQDDLEAVTTVVRVPAMLNFLVHGQPRYHQIMLIGIDDQTFGDVTDFRPYLTNHFHRNGDVFRLMELGYDKELPDAGWPYRREKFRHDAYIRQELESMLQDRAKGLPPIAQNQLPVPHSPSATTDSNQEPLVNIAKLPPLPTQKPVLPTLSSDVPAGAGSEYLSDCGPSLNPSESNTWNPAPVDALAAYRERVLVAPFDPITEQRVGIIIGIGIGRLRAHDPTTGTSQNMYFIRPGDDIELTIPSAGNQPRPLLENCTVVDFYSSKMHDYDSAFAFMPLSHLQKMRGMIDPATGGATVSAIQIKLKPEANLNSARDRLRAAFPMMQYPLMVQTWRDQQAPLLSAVEMEITILNILLFMIIAVAGFGILATFFMIVVEKTKDIGILKSLGAPSSGVMSIFLGYGLSLGIVGAGAGTLIGVMFVVYINEIAALISMISGREVFDPSIYFFSSIPTLLDPMMVVAVAGGAMLIAILSSVLPALRAARLAPVEALRYE